MTWWGAWWERPVTMTGVLAGSAASWMLAGITMASAGGSWRRWKAYGRPRWR
ncbi:MAG: hypothetical protein JWM19_3754 [Actinomycetia bacterium]|nr:hypothetical protein [Actinomycetes bacterium]